jgi:hypothetical protein
MKPIDFLSEFSGLANKIYQHWFTEFVFFLAVASEVIASIVITGNDFANPQVFTIWQVFTFFGISIYWYSLAVLQAIYVNIALARLITKIGGTFKIDLYHHLALFISGICLFSSVFIIKSISYFFLLPHQKMLMLLLAHVLWLAILLFLRSRERLLDKKLSASSNQINKNET